MQKNRRVFPVANYLIKEFCVVLGNESVSLIGVLASETLKDKITGASFVRYVPSYLPSHTHQEIVQGLSGCCQEKGQDPWHRPTSQTEGGNGDIVSFHGTHTSVHSFVMVLCCVSVCCTSKCSFLLTVFQP